MPVIRVLPRGVGWGWRQLSLTCAAQPSCSIFSTTQSKALGTLGMTSALWHGLWALHKETDCVIAQEPVETQHRAQPPYARRGKLSPGARVCHEAERGGPRTLGLAPFLPQMGFK